MNRTFFNLIVFLCVVSFSECSAEWKPETMNNQSWMNVMKQLMSDDVYGKQYQQYLLSKIHPCLTVPYINADRASRSRFNFQWYVDIDKQKYNDSKMVESLKKYEALVSVGLLDRNTIVFQKNDQTIDAIRYTLSQKGWETTSEVRAPFCFPYVDFRFEDVKSAQPRAISNLAGFEMYSLELKFKASIKKEAKAWIEERVLQDAYSEISKMLYEEHSINAAMIRGAKGWVDYDAMMQKGFWADNLTQRMEKYDKEPSQEVIKKRITDRYVHKAGTSAAEYHAYIFLPGTSEFPVDKIDSTLQRFEHQKVVGDEHYRVYIFDNIEKDKRKVDQIKLKTQPWLDELVQADIFIKKPYQNDSGSEKGYMYELKTSYLPYLNKLYVGFDIGDPKIIFDSIMIDPAKSYHAILAKFHMMYPNPPAWYNEKRFGKDSRMKKILKSGIVCFSEDDFSGSGGGSCSWKFPED
jgi:hypothetical protein